MHGRQSCGGRPGVNAINIGHDRQPAETGNEIAQDFESLASKIGLLVCQAGDVAIRSRQIRDQASANRVPQYEDAAAFRSASDNRSGGEAFSSGAWLAAPALRAIKLDCGRSPVSQLEIVVFELDRPVGEPVFESSAKQPTNWPSSFRWGSSAPHYLAPSRRRPSGAPSTIVRATRAAGSQPYLPSGFQGRCKTATLHAGLGVIRGMSGNVCIGQPDGAQRAI